MANRPVFTITNEAPFFDEKKIDFDYFPGFSVSQKQKCIDSLHKRFSEQNINSNVLEISSKSKQELGIKLSAFNLTIKKGDGQSFSVEVAFQSSKVFEHGGPYKDLLSKTPREAKKDERLRHSGRLLRFEYGNREFALNPTTYFYNWLYINALALQPELASQLIAFDAFTDIEFNPERSINCQAKSAAVYVSLHRKGLLDIALKDKDSFLEVVYGNTVGSTKISEQLSLWD